MRTIGGPKPSRAGLTLVEVAISGAVIVVVLAAVSSMVSRSARGLRSSTNQTYQEERIQVALGNIERQLEYAAILTPSTRLSRTLGVDDEERAELVDATGFPDLGTLLLFPGQPNEERIDYRGLRRAPDAVTALVRGAHCSDATTHEANSLVLWAGSATALDDQNAPPPGLWEGIALDNGRDVYFRGDGTGVVFRRPVDPAGGGNYLDALGNVRWGANVAGQDTTDGWGCLYFAPESTVIEAALGADLNNDGDQADRIDLGRIRQRTWNAANPGESATDIALTPPIVMQEQCAPGADLDGDDRQDPLFLWDPVVARLRVRLFFLLDNPTSAPLVRSADMAVFLRNGSLE